VEEATGGGEASAVNVVGGEAVLELEVDEGTGTLDEAFGEGVVGMLWSLSQPEFFQHVVGFVVVLLIKACHVASVVGG
jgi:hypothetical protein